MKLLLVTDGTVREPISGGHSILHPQDQRPIDKAFQALKRFEKQGYKIAVISNQKGVGANHKTLAECIKEQKFALCLFPMIDRIYFCPDMHGRHLWEVDRFKSAHLSEFSQYSDLRGTFKTPDCGMIHASQRLFEPTETILVGNQEADRLAAAKAEIQFFWAEHWQAEFAAVEEYNR